MVKHEKMALTCKNGIKTGIDQRVGPAILKMQNRRVTRGDYMLFTCIFYNLEGKYKNLGPKKFHVVASVCSKY